MPEQRKESKTKELRTKSTSFSARMTGVFAMIAIMTAVLMTGVAFLMWNMARGHLFSENNLLAALVIAAIVAVLFATLLGQFFATDIIKPVNRISAAASAIKDGDLSARCNLTGDDELGQLGQAFDAMADSIERDRDLERQLIGDVAHELRTPLMAMQATIEAIQDGVLPADEVRLSTLNAETRRLGRLVEALLHLNRLENGTIVAKKEPVALSESLADLVLNHQMLIESAGLGLEVAIEPGIRVQGDKDLINQAVGNLLSNAVRYTSEGGAIGVNVFRNGRYVAIAVADTGIGISQEDLKLVFSRFWRADSARDRASGGLGIGLALVKEVVDQHHGRITVESKLGEGSTFTMFLPLAKDDPGVLATLDKNELRRLRKQQQKANKAKKNHKAGGNKTGALPKLKWPTSTGKQDK